MHKTTLGAMALLAISVTGGMTAYGHDAPTVSSPEAIHDQTARHFQDVVKVLNTLGTVETPFDYITPASARWWCCRASPSTRPSRTTRRPRSRS